MKAIKTFTKVSKFFNTSGEPVIDNKTGKQRTKTLIGYSIDSNDVNKLIPIKTFLHCIPYIYVCDNPKDKRESYNLEFRDYLVATDNTHEYYITVDINGNITKTKCKILNKIDISSSETFDMKYVERNDDGLITTEIFKSKNCIDVYNYIYTNDRKEKKSEHFIYKMSNDKKHYGDYYLDSHQIKTVEYSGENSTITYTNGFTGLVQNKYTTEVSYSDNKKIILSKYYWDKFGHSIENPYRYRITECNKEGYEEIVKWYDYSLENNKYILSSILEYTYEYYED